MLHRVLSLACLSALLCPAIVSAAPDPYALAERLDRILDQHHRSNSVKSATPVDDARFLRRASLDIIGRIPTTDEVRGFLADKSLDKRRTLVKKLLKSTGYVDNSVNFWRALLLPEASTNIDMRFLQPGFETWLRETFRDNKPYDKFAYELVAAPMGNNQEKLNSPNDARANPLAFYTAKEGKPENLAASISRTFLGVQIECAQCHDHPFAEWSREHFWRMAAFFGGIERKGDGHAFDPMMREVVDRRELTIPNTERVVQAAFLDDTEPEWKFRTSARVSLAEWMTASNNKWFARALVNRLWAHYLGYGVVEPVDDFNKKNEPSVPALLDELTKAFVEAKFDLHFLITALTATQAYQRESAVSDPSQLDPRAIGRMPVKGLTGEQLYDSLVVATGYQEPKRKKGNDNTEDVEIANPSPTRALFLDKFALNGRKVDPQTSILQALSLMNGRFVADASSLQGGRALRAVASDPKLSTTERIESLYLATLSRQPTPEELRRVSAYIEAGGKDKLKQSLADLMWVLLNCAEFRLNH